MQELKKKAVFIKAANWIFWMQRIDFLIFLLILHLILLILNFISQNWFWPFQINLKKLIIKANNQKIDPNQYRMLRVAWQAQYYVMLDGGTCCSAHCTGRFIWGQDNHYRVIFRCRGSILWCRRVTLVAPRIVLDVSCVATTKRILVLCSTVILSSTE